MINATTDAIKRPFSPVHGVPPGNRYPGTKKMINNCNINGVPRNTHTNARQSQRSGASLLIEPNAMTRPSGKAPISVKKKSFKVCQKPSFNAPTTVIN